MDATSRREVPPGTSLEPTREPARERTDAPAKGVPPFFPVSRCLVTGGAGFIGSNLVRALLDAGCDVTVIDDFSTGRREHLPVDDRLDVVEGDLCSVPGLRALAARAEYVFHLAAQVGNVRSIAAAERDAATNVLGSVRLFEACRAGAVRKIVYSSSSATYGEAQRLPIDEGHPQSPASFYALSKQTAERYAVLAAGLWELPAVSLRYFNVFGLPMEESEYTGVISIFLRRLREGQPLVVYGDGGQVRDFVHVSDVVRANLAAARRGTPGAVYNVGTGVATSVRELATLLLEVTGRDLAVVHEPARPGEVRSSLADVSLAGAELGYRPAVTLRQGLAEMWDSLG